MASIDTEISQHLINVIKTQMAMYELLSKICGDRYISEMKKILEGIDKSLDDLSAHIKGGVNNEL